MTLFSDVFSFIISFTIAVLAVYVCCFLGKFKSARRKHKMTSSRRRARRGATPKTSTPPPSDSFPTPPPTPPLLCSPSSDMALVPRRLLVCSIGNPAPYMNTRHSIGHLVTNHLVEELNYPRFEVDRQYGGRVSISAQGSYTFFQSPSLMNISGRPVSTAWHRFRAELHPDERARALLVVIHDELEKGVGKIKVKSGGSHSGHNGIRSCMEKLKGEQFWRIGVGIGRTESREPKAVADWVLSKVPERDREVILAMSTRRVLEELERLTRLQEGKVGGRGKTP